MASSWTKHRRDEVDRAVDFADVLNTNESISSIDSIIVTDKDGNDVSGEFGSPGGSINGSKVEFTLGAASSSTEQTDDMYRVLIEITTSENEPKVATDSDGRVPAVVVSDDGDPDV